MAPPPLPKEKTHTHTHHHHHPHHHQKCYTFYFVCVFKTDKAFLCSSINDQECYQVFLNLVKHELLVYFDLLHRTQLIIFIYVLWKSCLKKIITENSTQFYKFWANYGWTSINFSGHPRGRDTLPTIIRDPRTVRRVGRKRRDESFRALSPVLENFCRAVSPDRTYCSWIALWIA